MERKTCVIIDSRDNVATALIPLKKGETVFPGGGLPNIVLLADIPFGHKFAVSAIGQGEGVLKYGEEIGVATSDIPVGGYVHIHNVVSSRGRKEEE